MDKTEQGKADVSASVSEKEIEEAANDLIDQLNEVTSDVKEAVGTEDKTKDDEGSSLGSKATYQDVLDEYSKKIKDKTPELIEEYKKESADISRDMQALAELSNKKVEVLAEISNEGVGKMAEIMLKKGDSYDIYEEWSQKLMDIYMEESKKITDAYMNSFGF
ncbi:MAG: hypothetical protein K5870_09535 [Lachnospiraceae bacterium]|nr:hypothetical protein [Lachnospiraceae bacterium]